MQNCHCAVTWPTTASEPPLMTAPAMITARTSKHVIKRAATSPNSPPTMKKIVTASEIELSGQSYFLLNAFG